MNRRNLRRASRDREGSSISITTRALSPSRRGSGREDDTEAAGSELDDGLPASPIAAPTTAIGTLGSALASLWRPTTSASAHLSASEHLRRGSSSRSEASTATISSSPVDVKDGAGWGTLLGLDKDDAAMMGSGGAAAVKRRSRGAIPFQTSYNGTEGSDGAASKVEGSAEAVGLNSHSLDHALGTSLPIPEESLSSDAYSTLNRLKGRGTVSAASKPKGTLGRAGSLRSFSTFFGSASADVPEDSKSAPRRASTQLQEQSAKTEELDEHVRKMVFQAGLDFESRPMVILAGCRFPDPKKIDYDALLDRIMSTMDLFVENDYTIILFASGASHRPGWNWIWKAYRRLGRKFRKNLKQLYIVHPTFFTRSLVHFISAGAYFVSPKFARKIIQVPTLSALAEHVPISQIDIPPEVLQINARFEKSVKVSRRRGQLSDGDDSVPTRIFGAPLEDLMGERGEKGGIPRAVKDCVELLNGTSASGASSLLDTEGLFRRSPSSVLLRAAQDAYDRGSPVDLTQYTDPHVPAVLLKIFLRSLPHPIFPPSSYPLIRACPSPLPPAHQSKSSGLSENERAQETSDYIRNTLLPSIAPPCALILLSYVLELFHVTSLHSEQNRMDAANLATVLTPNLVTTAGVKDVSMCRVEGLGSMSEPFKPATASSAGTTLGTVIKVCIERYYEIFDEMDFEPPLLEVAPELNEMGNLSLEGSAPTLSTSVSAATTAPPPDPNNTLSDSYPAANHKNGATTLSHLRASMSAPIAHDLHPRASQDTEATPSQLTARSNNGDSSLNRGPIGMRTMGRNSSGSLRLTKGRLGSGFLSVPSTSSSITRLSTGTSTPSELRDGVPALTVVSDKLAEPVLTSASSGVTVSSANALGSFSTPNSTLSSPSTPSGSVSRRGANREAHARRGLSEVMEDIENS